MKTTFKIGQEVRVVEDLFEFGILGSTGVIEDIILTKYRVKIDGYEYSLYGSELEPVSNNVEPATPEKLPSERIEEIYSEVFLYDPDARDSWMAIETLKRYLDEQYKANKH